MKIQDIEMSNIGQKYEEKKSISIDSGLLVVVFIIAAMIFIVFFVLFYVKYEWCPVLFTSMGSESKVAKIFIPVTSTYRI